MIGLKIAATAFAVFCVAMLITTTCRGTDEYKRIEVAVATTGLTSILVMAVGILVAVWSY